MMGATYPVGVHGDDNETGCLDDRCHRCPHWSQLCRSAGSRASCRPCSITREETIMSERGRILGIGGIFFRSANQQEMKAWYATHLGLAGGGRDVVLPWREKDHPEREHMTVWSIFPDNTKYFEPSPASFMLNYIVDDLDALLDRL